MRTLLHDGWTLRPATASTLAPDRSGGVTLPTGPVPAQVPGCTHLDLLAAGVIPDPYLDENEAAVAWVGRVNWCYETTFAWSASGFGDLPCWDLVAEGLDTVAAVELNGQLLGRTANQHRSHTFDVSTLLRDGENRLSVTFAAGEPAAYAADAADHRPYVGLHPFNALRKMASSYGWDWGPVLVTAGIWKPLALHGWATARITAVRPLVDVEPGPGTDPDRPTGVLRAHVDLRRSPGEHGELTLTAEVGGVRTSVRVPAGATSAVVEVRVPDVQRWWPRGYGEQPLYDVGVELAGADSSPLDTWTGRVGFRTVGLDTTPDADGTPFTVTVNDTPVFVRGVNWIPEDCFPVRVDAARYARRLDQAVGLGANLVRVWGGGLYESDDFYDACDERGLLVWQDFLFACAAYAEEEPLQGEVEAEAREAVTRLARHPSLVLWNGNNENIWGFHDWGWQAELGGATWGWGYYADLLPRIVAELDPTRPYCPGTPYAMRPDLPPNDEAHGPTHLWDVWNSLDYTAYRSYRPRFVAEFGWQGPPTWATLTRAVHDDPLTPTSPGMLAHQKAEDGQGKLARGLTPHLPEPQTFDDWHWATSLVQARAVQTGVEHLRSLTPLCTGAIVWQLNDCWPVVSWAAVDGDGRRKPLWYALRRAFADRLASVQPGPGANELVVALHNDAPKPWTGRVVAERHALDGALLARAELPFSLAPRAAASLTLPESVSIPGDPAREVLVVSADPTPGSGAERAWWSFAEDRDTALPVPELEAGVEPVTGGCRVRVTARTYLKDLALLADRVAPDAEVDTMLVTLLPGESVELLVSTLEPLDLAERAALVGPAVLRCANQLVTGVGDRI
ncbi:MAG TPA: glycoside hydrolase family 2 protein [Friedmanniella sp.]